MTYTPPSLVPDSTWTPPSFVPDDASSTRVGMEPVDTKAVARTSREELGNVAMAAVPPLMSGLGAGIGALTAPLTGPYGAIAGSGIGWGVGGEIQRAQKKALGRSVSEGAQRVSDFGNNINTGLMAEGGGQAVSALMKGGAKGLMRTALRPTAKTLARTPKLIENAIEQGATVGGAGPLSKVLGGGSNEAWRKVMASDDKLQPLLQGAAQKGWQMTAEDYSPAMESYIKKNIEGKTPHWQDRANEIRMWFKQFAEQNGSPPMGPPAPMGPMEIQALKKGAQDEARAVYNKGPVSIPPSTLREAKFHKALASIMRESLETIPGVAERNQISKPLIETAEAVKRAEGLHTPLSMHAMQAAMGGAGALVHGGPGGPIGHGLAAYLLSKGLTSPWMTSRGALMMNASAPFMGQLPRAGLAAFQYANPDEITR